MNKLKLDSTSALNIQWGRNSFDCKIIDSMIEHLDLSEGELLYNKCNAICDWYEEVILNRDYFTINFINEQLITKNDEHLIIILAAGNSPLSLEILKNNYPLINKILEIDSFGMDEKQELYDNYFPEYSEKIKCITADIKASSMLSLLNSLLHEYYNEIPCIIILEGVSYYITEGDLKNIISSFKSDLHNNTLIIESLLPYDDISADKKNIPTNVFETIKDEKGLSQITSYSKESLYEIFSSSGGILLEDHNLTDLEKFRLGENKFFPNPNDGCIECSVWQL